LLKSFLDFLIVSFFFGSPGIIFLMSEYTTYNNTPREYKDTPYATHQGGSEIPKRQPHTSLPPDHYDDMKNEEPIRHPSPYYRTGTGKLNIRNNLFLFESKNIFFSILKLSQ
jgi:hypothetical protein